MCPPNPLHPGGKAGVGNHRTRNRSGSASPMTTFVVRVAEEIEYAAAASRREVLEADGEDENGENIENIDDEEEVDDKVAERSGVV